MDSNCSPPQPFGPELLQEIQAFADRLAEEGWISSEAAKSLTRLTDSPAFDLFDGHGRPLVAAFFGGTGVGKSTLLNRLAGEKVAKTGIERPTSREVTFYLHASAKLERLPPGLPLDKVNIARHRSTNRREVVWIDMPDIDSVEHTNRELALALLPYIDVLIYVVSPERYRDDAGWCLLVEHSLSSAWLFVMNHWDEGCEDQIEDFIHQLESAGFNDPIVLRCDSRPELRARKPDDFGKLEEILTAFVRAHGLEQLTARNEYLRLEQVTEYLNSLLEALGDTAAPYRLCARWRVLWKEAVEAIQPGLKWSSEALAKEVIQQPRTPTPSPHRWNERGVEGEGRLNQALLWDSWVSQSLMDALDRLILEAEKLGLPPEPIRRRLAPCRSELQKILIDQVQVHLRRCLAAPGHWLQRGGLRCFGVLRYMMPLAASAWAGYQLVLRYYQEFYLGIDFAVHSLLLIGLAWLVPHLFHRLLEPSLERAALQGIWRGLVQGFEQVAAAVERHLHSFSKAQADMAREGKRLTQALRLHSNPLPPPSRREGELKEIFGRMLAKSRRATT